MGFLVHTFLKRIANSIFELHPSESGINAVNAEIQPVVQIQPYLDVFESRASSGTLFTTPSDRDFYLTNVVMSAGQYQTPGATNTLTIVLADGVTKTIYLPCQGQSAGDGTSASYTIPLTNRGLLLQRNSAITFTLVTDLGSVAIVGYRGSDRSSTQ